MLNIDENNNITLTRGDSASISVGLKNPDGSAYTLQTGDVLFFTVKYNCITEDIIIQKDISTDAIINIIPSDTAALLYGEYFYDVQLTKANGEVNTVIPPRDFIVAKEVTFVGGN
ncbi:MAG: hypothetical protein J6S67_17915 [Methanobrevibacter sp.]|nr:hypothetical protein [Methanobrevibacter sp.]